MLGSTFLRLHTILPIGSKHDALISNRTAKQMEDDVSLNIKQNLPRILWKGKF